MLETIITSSRFSSSFGLSKEKQRILKSLSPKKKMSIEKQESSQLTTTQDSAKS